MRDEERRIKVRYPTRENGRIIVPGLSRKPRDLVFEPDPEAPRILSAQINIRRTARLEPYELESTD